mgnify:CR=1 FL=1
MKIKNFAALLLALAMMFSLCACGSQSAPAQDTPQPSEAQESAAPSEAPSEITVTDMIGRELTVTPGSYTRVVCIGAGALRMYSYIGDVSLLCGVEDIDNLTLEERPKMFDSVARPYVLAYGDVFSTLPSCGVGGPNAQAAEAEKILSCNPDIVISEYEDVEKEDALQEQLGVPVVTLKSGPNGVFDDAFSQSMTLLGQIFGEEEKAEALVSFIAAETAEIAERTASIADEDKPAVYVCGLGNWGTTNHLMTSQTYASFEVANIRNVVTDLGANGVQPIEEEKFVALGADMLLLESNHDVVMLKNGGYPYYLKQRILSEYGHLSNDAAAEFAIECVRAGTSDILLAHLSDENNSPQLAEYTVGRALQSSGLSVRLAAAPRDTISEVHVCRRSPSFASEN